MKKYNGAEIIKSIVQIAAEEYDLTMIKLQALRKVYERTNNENLLSDIKTLEDELLYAKTRYCIEILSRDNQFIA